MSLSVHARKYLAAPHSPWGIIFICEAGQGRLSGTLCNYAVPIFLMRGLLLFWSRLQSQNFEVSVFGGFLWFPLHILADTLPIAQVVED